MNIVLIGYRGTGKTVVAEILSRTLGMGYIGMDAEIVRKAGLSIPDFIERFGWDRFRDLETEVALHAAQLDQVIVDTGGGVIERPENMTALKRSGMVFWLKASVEMIVPRIESGTERPALTREKSFTEEVAEVLERRKPLYSCAAHVEIDTDHITPEQVAARITEIWKSR